MAFKSEDIYTASGDAKLFNAWTPYVSKFDTSSFYNWEQDNLPLYDLEERTYELWEQQGWPTSSVPGLALTVSADADAVSLAAESTLFTDVSSAIAAIPKIVRFPVLVEVGSFDELGPLELHNFRIEEGGSIEIINRNFGRFYNASSVAKSISTPLYNPTHNVSQTVSSVDLENTITTASCVHLGIPILSSTLDARFSGTSVRKGGFFAYPKFTNKEGILFGSIEGSYRATNDQYVGLSYENNATTLFSDTSLSSYDISSISDLDSTILTRTQISLDDPITGNLYGNDLTKISVKNCDGPIYIRNFFVNGTRTNPDYGIEITNSDVVLENCSVARANKAGFKFNNSKVVLSRSAFSYRNYTLTNGGSDRASKVGAGFHAVNSEVTVSSNIATVGASDGAKDYGASGTDVTFVASRNYAGFILDNSKLVGGFGRTTVTSPGTGGIVATEANSGPGFLLKNSEIDLSGLIECYFNNVGVESYNSVIRTQNFCAESQQGEGYLGKNSLFILDSDLAPGTAGQVDRAQILFYNNRQHIVAKNNTDFTFEVKDSIPSKYGNCLLASSHGAEIWGIGGAATAKNLLPSIAVEGGSNLELLHPKITITELNGLGTGIYGAAIKAIRNSSVSLFGTSTGCTFVGTPLAEQNVAALYANNSVINLHGPTVIGNFGVDVLVENNSTLNIKPPTIKDERGYAASAFSLGDSANHTSVELHSTRACLVADNNSTINLTDLGDFEANWERTDTGVGVLANLTDFFDREINVSGIIYKGSLQFYPNPADETVLTDNGLGAITAITTELPISNSFPTFTTTGTINTFIVDDDPILSHNTAGRGVVSKGGVCVRVLGNSVINAHNVHFPSGNEGGFLDGLIYNVSGSDCDKLMIWNIADNSKLNASYLAVSGSYPTDAAYHGPSALYVSSSVTGTNDPAYVIASGAPDGTPDTGPLSVLDAFGAGSSLQWGTTRGIDINSPFDRYYPPGGIVATTRDQLPEGGLVASSTESLFYGIDGSSANTGPFRIYWSVSPAAKVLATDVSGYAYGGNNTANFSGVVGPAYQIFSQGYNLSAEASALNLVGGTNASSVFPQLLKQSRDTDSDGQPDAYATSGFYYCSEFVESNPTQCMLDESAAATFANAKNASLGSSGRPKKVTIYKAEADDVGNRGSEAYQGDSEVTIGFRSANVFDLRRFN